MHSPLIPNSPQPFVRIILRRPPPLSSPDIRPQDSTPVFTPLPPNFFFKPRPSVCRRSHKSKLFFSNSRSPLESRLELAWLVQRRDAVAKKGDRGVLGKEGMQS